MNKLQMFCFTYAGGNASFFDDIEKDIPEAEFIKLEYAGHGMRHRENFYSDFNELGADMFSELKYKQRGDYAMFGYSMGSISLVETLKRIIGNGLKLPEAVFLAAHEPHTKSELLGFEDNELDEWVKDRTIRFGAVPEKLMNNMVYWRTYLPLYRADYKIIGRFDFDKLDLDTDIPADIFFSETDTPYADMQLWSKYFKGSIDFHRFEGNHFFIKEHHREIADIIKGRLGI